MGCWTARVAPYQNSLMVLRSLHCYCSFCFCFLRISSKNTVCFLSNIWLLLIFANSHISHPFYICYFGCFASKCQVFAAFRFSYFSWGNFFSSPSASLTRSSCIYCSYESSLIASLAPNTPCNLWLACSVFSIYRSTASHMLCLWSHFCRASPDDVSTML